MDICLTQNRFCLPLPAMIWSIFAKIIRGKLEEISRMNPQTQCSQIEKKNHSHFTLAYSQSWDKFKQFWSQIWAKFETNSRQYLWKEKEEQGLSLNFDQTLIFPHQIVPKRYTWPFLSPLIIRVSDESMTMESQYLFFVDVISQQSTTTIECLACTVHCHEWCT